MAKVKPWKLSAKKYVRAILRLIYDIMEGLTAVLSTMVQACTLTGMIWILKIQNPDSKIKVPISRNQIPKYKFHGSKSQTPKFKFQIPNSESKIQIVCASRRPPQPMLWKATRRQSNR